MTALILEGFDHYGTGSASIANMLDGVWATNVNMVVNTPSWGTARTGTGCLQLPQGSSTPWTASIVVPGSPATMYVSLGFATDYLPPGSLHNICEFRDTGNNVMHYVCVNPTGSVSLYTGSGTLLGTTSGPVIRAQTWHFIEMKMDYTGGQFIMRVDDTQATNTPAMTVTVSGTTNGFFAFKTYSNQFATGYPNFWFDDLFIRNSAGTVNNSWLGDRRISAIYAAADTTTAGWSPTFYQKFGTGVLQLATLGTNTTSPTNANASIYMGAATAFDLGNSDFTLEGWVRFEQLPGAANYSTIFSRWDSANNKRSYRLLLGGTSYNSGSLQFDYSTDGTNANSTTAIKYPFTPTLNAWYHIAVVRASNQLLLFVNGVQLGLPIACSATFYGGGSEVMAIGAEYTNTSVVGNTYLVGLMDETRFTNGYARYTSTFTAPTAAFPRGSGSDTQWSNVTYLAGYNTTIGDESSYANSISTAYNAAVFTPNDGSSIGSYTSINKAIPDDNTFIAAAFLPATGILTMTTQPSNGDTVTVGTKNGSTAAVYTFKTTISTSYDVLIDTTAQLTLTNLLNAINAGTGIGTKYGTGTLANYNVTASALPAGQILVTANLAGTTGNTIASTKTGTAASWGGTTLSGGANIPGPSAFSLQPPPPNTTVISALQSIIRGYKTDSGTCSVQPTLVGGLGGTANGSVHTLATNPGYYNDIFETDPDTSSSISPATILNGKLQINRTA